MMAVCIAVSLCYEYIDSIVDNGYPGRVSWIGVLIGIAIAMPLALLEESRFDEWARRLPFSVALLLKSAVYLGSLLAVFMSGGLITGFLQGLRIEDFWRSVSEPDYYIQAAVGFSLYVFIVFFRQLDRLLGPGQLLRYITGRYHRPHRETRIFMFLDLKSSTALAEQLRPESYYQFVNEFFHDISGPVLDRDGEIYEYVGDEVVLTWKVARGIKDANCIRVFFDIDAVIESKRQHYMDSFGVVPQFKAGVHMGDVIAAVIGDLKKGLVFNGDVLNTGARIEAECGRLAKRLLASAELVERLTIPEGLTADHMGPTVLRGKTEPLELVALA